MSAPENPPAFPSVGEGFGNPDYSAPGMTLRDHFAGQALPSVVMLCARDTLFAGETLAELFARKSFEIADAMLAERKKGGAL